jgi:hypothetical protein
LVIIGTLLIVFAFAKRQPNEPSAPSPKSPSTALPAQPSAAPKLLIRIEQQDYSPGGYFHVVGTVRNVGNKPAHDPRLELVVFDTAGTVRATGATAPAGHRGIDMVPGAAAAFEFMLRIPGEPAEIRSSLTANHPAEVRWLR